MNTVVSIVVVFVVGIAGAVLTFPELPLVPLVTTAVLVATIFPIVFYPFSKTVWTAIDLRLRPLEPGEVKDGAGAWLNDPAARR